MPRIYLLLCLLLLLFTNPVQAISNPRENPNNIVGINILSPETEIHEASKMVNSEGDWGWVVIIIKKSERNVDRWQSFFHELTKYHLIPIVRIATEQDKKGYWQRPSDEDAASWADFLSKLYWPTKNRYVQIYNEVNHANEWGGKVDAPNYTKELDKTINALKNKSEDFFPLNAPLDLAAENSTNSMDALIFIKTMRSIEPNIFDKLDGWASHSYPNPDFTSSPYKTGRTSIQGYKWELAQISPYTEKDLPVFITETGWKRGDENEDGLTQETISQNYLIAFTSIWDDKKIVAVAPFVFNYPEDLFDEFSFKKSGGDPAYYKQFETIKALPKIKGKPLRENMSSEIETNLPYFVIKDLTSRVKVKVKNTGNYIWNTKNNLKLNINAQNLEIGEISWNKEEIFPGQDAQALFDIKSTQEGAITVSVSISDSDQILTQSQLSILSETYFSLLIHGVKNVFGLI